MADALIRPLTIDAPAPEGVQDGIHSYDWYNRSIIPVFLPSEAPTRWPSDYLRGGKAS